MLKELFCSLAVQL